MTQLNVPIDKTLREEFKKSLTNETLEHAVTRLIMEEMGWSDDYMEQKEILLKTQIEDLKSELKETQEYLKSRFKEKMDFLKSKDIKGMWKEPHPTWEGDKNLIPEYRHKGITWHFLYTQWEEL